MKVEIEKLIKLWEMDKLNKQEIIIPVQFRLLRRCDGKDDVNRRCVMPAIWIVKSFYDGELKAVRYYCSKHLNKWEEALDDDVRRGVVSLLWDFEVKRFISPKTVRKLVRMALIHSLR